MDLQRMNWGCGPAVADGWVNVDIDAPVVDAKTTHGFAAGSFDGIVANHSLQCLTYDQLDPQVAEFRRVLRFGGHLRVIVPDVLDAFAAFACRDDEWPGFAVISEDWSLDRKFAHYVTWGGQNRTCFTGDTLRDLLRRHGFVIQRVPHPMWTWMRELDSRHDESLIVEAIAS